MYNMLAKLCLSKFLALSSALPHDGSGRQIPLTVGQGVGYQDIELPSPPPPPWRLNFSSSAPHLFSSMYLLLQQWGNTVFPNGHTLAAVEIPAYTLLYHGRIGGDLPPSPEWLAFDVEMSYGIMGSTTNSHMLTYQTTRPVKAVYFDGESAALMGLGQLDTQMLHLFGNVSGPPPDPDSPPRFGLFGEYQRAIGLCDWLESAGLRGLGWGFEGVVRMNAGFEVIWCNFTSPSLRLLSHLNVTAPRMPKAVDSQPDFISGSADVQTAALSPTPSPQLPIELPSTGSPALDASQERQQTSYYTLPPLPTRTDRSREPSRAPMPPNWRFDFAREPFLQAQGWGWFTSATYHYGSARGGNGGGGETRARVLGCGVLSYYQPMFWNQSLNRAKAEGEAYNLTEDGLWKGPGKDGNRTDALLQLARRRRFHHLEQAVPWEADLMRKTSEVVFRELLDSNDNNCTGADWVLMTREIVQRTAVNLKELQHHLATLPSPDNDRGNENNDDSEVSPVLRWLLALRANLHGFVVGVLEYPEKHKRAKADTTEHPWRVGSAIWNATYSRCRYRYTRLLVPDDGDDADENGSWRRPTLRSELDSRWAVEEVFGTVCDVLLRLYFGVEAEWEDWADTAAEGTSESQSKETSRDQRIRSDLAPRWADAVDELTAWLGWESEFIGCPVQCAWYERCYIPMWPLIAWRRPPERPHPPPRPTSSSPSNETTGSPTAGPTPSRSLSKTVTSTRPSEPPRFTMPPRGPWWMGDDTDLWAPKCVGIDYLMGRRNWR